MAETQKQDTGLVQRGLLLLGGMTALVVVVMLIALRRPETAGPITTEQSQLILPGAHLGVPFPAALAWPVLSQLEPQMPSAPGWEIRYNAAVTLARRGSPQTPWPLVSEMLDLEKQRRNFRLGLKKGRLMPDEESAQRTIQNALAAIAGWHQKQDRNAPPTVTAELQLVYQNVDRLAQGSNNLLKVQADRTRQLFFRK